jgi:hypothetical protein
MNTKEVAEKLCEHCRNGTEAEGLKTLYAEHAQSVEAMTPPGMDPVAKGRDAIKAKHEWWNGAMEVHSIEVEGPFIHGNSFAVLFRMDVSDKASGKRWQGSEIGLYEVEDGKIVREAFYMPPMG